MAPTSPTTYTCIVTIGACSDTASISVTIDPVPVALVSGVTSVCQGSSVSLSGSGGTTYSWNTSDTTSSINVSPSSTTTYLVTVSNACGSDTASITVNVITAPTVNAFSDQTILLGSSASISATGATSYEWSPAGGLSCITCANPTASPTSTTTYMVVGTDANGCTDTAYVTITVDINTNVFVPDIFSPDGNGANDLLFVRGLGIEEFTFRVYDRWGQKVFESTSLSEGWDGTFRGKLLNTAVFIYTLDGTYVTGETFSQKGNITLKR